MWSPSAASNDASAPLEAPSHGVETDEMQAEAQALSEDTLTSMLGSLFNEDAAAQHQHPPNSDNAADNARLHPSSRSVSSHRSRVAVSRGLSLDAAVEAPLDRVRPHSTRAAVRPVGSPMHHNRPAKSTPKATMRSVPTSPANYGVR